MRERDLERVAFGKQLLAGAIEIDPQRRSGRPVLRGTGFTVAQVLAELIERTPREIADNFNVPCKAIEDVLDGLSVLFDEYDANHFETL